MFTDRRTDGYMDERTDVRSPERSPSEKVLELMIKEQYAKVSYIPSAYSYQGSSVRMVAICGPVGTHRAPCGSYMRRELYAALHYNHHFIDSK